ncbi:MAG TPA: hypothetical protein VGS16_17780 [Candidatus Dormibacteraeota bacterium]|nr:hypothetical protein [Candidatus Dormibacteraeota bacterium]
MAGLLMILVIAACDDSGTGATPSTPLAAPPTGPALSAQVVASQLTVGVRRVPIGIVDHNTPVTDATVHIRAFASVGGSAQLKDEADAPFRGEGLQGAGLYIAQLRLDTVGQWVAQVIVQRPGGSAVELVAPFKVLSVAVVPAVGQAAPRSRNQTLADVQDASYIDSGNPPDDMHTISIADAIAQHRQALVVFATPAFCESSTCGPQVHAVQMLEPTYRDRLTFIHVEIYRNFKPDPSKRQLTATVLEWNLQTEPWVFLIDARGTIAAEFEAVTAADELKVAVEQLLSRA